jgi:hypothetical protein
MDAKPETGKDAWTRDQMQKIARLVNEELPDGWGFFVMAYPFNDLAGRMNYVANGERSDVLKLMREFIAKNENPADWMKHK